MCSCARCPLPSMQSGTKPQQTPKWCYSPSFSGSARIHWTKVRLTTDHCARDERVRPARCLCRCWGSEWGDVETTPQRPKILKPPPNHPPQNKPPTATKRLPLSLAPISSRAYSIPVHVSSPSTFPETCQQIVRQPPTLAARRGTRPEWLLTCQACPTRALPRRAVDLLSSSPRSCTPNAAVILPEPYRFLAAILVSMDASQPP